MARSIRRSLTIWYATALLLVVGSFGALLAWRLWRAATDEVDAELRAHAQAIAGTIEPYGGGQFDLELSDAYTRYFREQGEDAPYYVIWDAKGAIVDRSAPTVEVPRPDGPGSRERGYLREIAASGPVGTLVLVGRGTHDRTHRFREFLGAVLGAGGVVLLVALVGGWFLAGRALAPIERISATAQSLSSRDLSGRIPIEQTEDELGRLASVLNDTFARLQEAFDRQTRFTADASHELRTPLSIVISHLDLALRKDRTPEEYREAIETALRGAERMRAVVEGLLTLARADTGTVAMARERVDLKRAVEETLSFLSSAAAEKKVTLVPALGAAGVIGDSDRLREVITNLVTNAIRYNREDGRVDVRLAVEDGQAVLTVRDTGIGIPAEDQERVFERFYRVDKVRSRGAGGSGLGLPITRWIVEAHGGTIGFTSRLGEGTAFTVRLPAAT